MKRLIVIVCLLLFAKLTYAGFFDWSAWDGGPIEKYRFMYSIGYDSILRQNIGLGLFAIQHPPGEWGEECGYFLEGKIGENGYHLSIEYAATAFSVNNGNILTPYGLGGSIGLSYIYNSENGTVYSSPASRLTTLK